MALLRLPLARFHRLTNTYRFAVFSEAQELPAAIMEIFILTVTLPMATTLTIVCAEMVLPQAQAAVVQTPHMETIQQVALLPAYSVALSLTYSITHQLIRIRLPAYYSAMTLTARGRLTCVLVYGSLPQRSHLSR